MDSCTGGASTRQSEFPFLEPARLFHATNFGVTADTDKFPAAVSIAGAVAAQRAASDKLCRSAAPRARASPMA